MDTEKRTSSKQDFRNIDPRLEKEKITGPGLEKEKITGPGLEKEKITGPLSAGKIIGPLEAEKIGRPRFPDVGPVLNRPVSVNTRIQVILIKLKKAQDKMIDTDTMLETLSAACGDENAGNMAEIIADRNGTASEMVEEVITALERLPKA